MYQVELSETAFKQFQKLDQQISKFIFAWIKKHLQGIEDPRSKGKKLVGNRKDIWRYRIGDYRLLCKIEEDKLVVMVIEVGHRRSIYTR